MKLSLDHLPLLVALLLLAGGGAFLLSRSDRQARDTIRKHHLYDIEQSLYFARSIHGTYPPYDQASWCGLLDDDQANKQVRGQLEQILRKQNEKYGNLAKPFPVDPLGKQGYFYWKRSPAAFELYAILEDAPTGERNTTDCPTAPSLTYDYGISSVQRENGL